MLGISVPTSIIECSVISTLLPISLSLSKLGLISLIHSCRGVGDQTIILDDDVLKTIHDALITFMYGD